MTNQSDNFSQMLDSLSRLTSSESIDFLRNAIRNNPNDVRPVLLLAAELTQVQAFDQAEATYISLLNSVSDMHIARFQLGLLQLTQGRIAAASATWSLLDDLGDGHYLWQFKTGLHLAVTNEIDQALYWLNRGILTNLENEPLNHDMQLVIENIKSALFPLQQENVSGGSSTTADSGSSHLFASAYKNLH